MAVTKNVQQLVREVATNASNDSQDHQNVTYLPLPVFDETNLISLIVKGTMFFLSLFGNLSSIIQMYKKRRRNSTINTLIINLTTADLLVTFFCMGTEAIWMSTVQWYAGDFMCKFVKFAQIFAFNLSTYITVVISMDRCFAIMDPISKNKAPKRVRIMIMVSWCLCALFSIPQILIFRVVQGPFKERFIQCMDVGYSKVAWAKRVYSIVSLLFSFAIPLLIMGIAYGLISGTIRRKSKDFKAQEESSCTSENGQLRGQVRSHLFRKAKRKALQISIVIVAAFVVCWTPYYVVFMYSTFLDLPEMPRRTMLALSFIGLSNSLLNPMIYGAFHLCKVHTTRSWKSRGWPSHTAPMKRSSRRNNQQDEFLFLKQKNIVVLYPDMEDTRKDSIKQQCWIVLYKARSASNKCDRNIVGSESSDKQFINNSAD